MGNCIRRETGIEKEENANINHEEIFMNIVKIFLTLEKNERSLEK